MAGFPWSECQVRETGDKSLYTSNIYKVETTCGQTGRLSEELLAFDGAKKFLFMGKSS